MSREEAERLFRIDAESAGLSFPNGIEADDRWHSVPAETGSGRKPNKGSYRFTNNGRPRGIFRRWNAEPVGWTCPDETWRAIRDEDKAHGRSTLADLKRETEAKAAENAELRASQDAAAARAVERWNRAEPLTQSVGYLQRKRVESYGLRIEEHSVILIPLYRAKDELRGYQTIHPNGEKRYARGMERTGTYYPIPGTLDTVYICEGYATGATIRAATGALTVCSMDSTQLGNVAAYVRSLLPSARLVIAADDDHKTTGNPGAKAARIAAERTGAEVRSPIFPEGRGDKDTDYNDLAALTSIEEVRRQLIEELHSAPPEPATDEEPPAVIEESGIQLADKTHARLPRGYALSESGALIRREVDRNGEPRSIPISFPPIFLAARSVDIQTGTRYATIATGWPKLGSLKLHVPAETIASTRTIVALSAQGLPVTSNSARDLVNYLDACREEQERSGAPITRLSHSTGWKDGAFLRGYDETHYPPGEESGALYLAPLEGEIRAKVEAIRSRGDFTTWRESTERVLAAHPRVAFPFAASVVAPLIEIIGCEQFCLDIHGESSGGKSTSVKWAASIFGSASLVGQWNDTATAVERVAGALRGLPVYRDETQHMLENFSVVTAFVYAITQGRGKARGTITGTQTTVEYQNIAISTGESSISTMGKQAGTVSRLVSIKAPMLSSNDSASAELIHQQSALYARHHGTAGQRYIEHLVRLSPEERADLAERYRALTVAVYAYAQQTHPARDTTRRVANHVASMEFSWSTFTAAIGLAWTPRGPYGLFSAADLTAIFDSALDADKPSQALDALTGYFAANYRRIQYHDTAAETHASTIGKVWTNRAGSTLAAIIPHEAASFLRSAGFAVDAVIAAFVEKGYFQLSSDKRSTHKVRIGGGDVRVYVFSDEISKSLAEFPRKDEQPAAAPSDTRFTSFPD